MLTFQEIIDNLNSYWKKKGCIQIQSYDLEMGAATFHPSTVLRVIDKEPWSAIFLQPCRRPSDGRYGKNPIGLHVEPCKGCVARNSIGS